MHAEVERCRGGDWWTLESGFPAQPGTGLIPDLVRQAGQHEARGVSFQLPVSLTGLPQGRALSQALTLETASGSLHETQPGPPPFRTRAVPPSSPDPRAVPVRALVWACASVHTRARVRACVAVSGADPVSALGFLPVSHVAAWPRVHTPAPAPLPSPSILPL